MNNDLKMIEQINNIKKERPNILLHACCAPCSSSVIERLSEIFIITILFYNPNITDEKEYKKRLEELEKFVLQFQTKNPVSVLEGRYLPDEFFKISKNLENEAEKGARCYKCYQLRLKETAKIASEKGYDYFGTTLTLSPYKKTDWVNHIGEILDKEYSANYLYSDFKKKNGYKRSIELSKEYGLYRQDYCGCVFSKRDMEKQKHTMM